MSVRPPLRPISRPATVMRDRADPNLLLDVNVEDGVGESLQWAGPEFTEFHRVEMGILDKPSENLLKLSAKLLAQASLLTFIASSSLFNLFLGVRMEDHRFHG